MNRRCLRILCVLLTCALLTVSAAAVSGVSWSTDTTLTKKVNQYSTVSVSKGTTVTLAYSGDAAEPTGLWITKSLTVQSGGHLVGSAAGGGSGLLIFDPGASVSGLDLYYSVSGVPKKLVGGLAKLHSINIPTPGETTNFTWNAAYNVWVLQEYPFETDPFPDEQTAPSVPQTPGGVRQTEGGERAARALQRLGLFKGVGENADGSTNFALLRAPTRLEALVILIRLLGREEEALSQDWSHPFTDVPVWPGDAANRYVGYAYRQGLTNGSSDTAFGTGSANCRMFLTFVLRALGMEDGAEGTVWDRATDLAASCGLLPEEVNQTEFFRCDAAVVSWEALRAQLSDGSGTLADRLMHEGVFTGDDYMAAGAMR